MTIKVKNKGKGYTLDHFFLAIPFAILLLYASIDSYRNYSLTNNSEAIKFITGSVKNYKCVDGFRGHISKIKMSLNGVDYIAKPPQKGNCQNLNKLLDSQRIITITSVNNIVVALKFNSKKIFSIQQWKEKHYKNFRGFLILSFIVMSPILLILLITIRNKYTGLKKTGRKKSINSSNKVLNREKSLIANAIRKAYPELSSWENLEIYKTWSQFSKDIHGVDWYEFRGRENSFVFYIANK